MAEKCSSSAITTNSMLGDVDEFEGAGMENNTVPDDNDEMEIQQQERDAWEVRELIRILHEADIAEEKRKEKLEIETRRKMSDGELYDQPNVRLPEEARRNNNNIEQKGKYLQIFHHRGAFYMDEDTLNQAGKDTKTMYGIKHWNIHVRLRVRIRLINWRCRRLCKLRNLDLRDILPSIKGWRRSILRINLRISFLLLGVRRRKRRDVYFVHISLIM